MSAVFCQNDQCSQFKATGNRRFIGETNGTYARLRCDKCRGWSEVKAVLQTAT